jgi:hypothetical protein
LCDTAEVRHIDLPAGKFRDECRRAVLLKPHWSLSYYSFNMSAIREEAVPEANSPGTKRDWIDVTVRLATSWVGLFTAYIAALILGLTKYKEFTTGLQQIGVKPWIGILLIVSFPLFAILFSTIPSVIERRRIQRYADIKVDVRAGYFTLRPRETEQDFERVDQAHEAVLLWIKNSSEPVLYLTGASGTGKSSLLAAWVIPKLTRRPCCH